MISCPISQETLRKKKFFILICGVVIFFITSMAKVLIPATIFQDLQEQGMDVNKISFLGAAFLYAYAASQLFMGCFSDRYGGVRILLIGGSLFSFGTILFPQVEYYPLMVLLRLITGFGAGTIFLGVAKLLGDLFSEKFAAALGITLFISYLGPTTGTMPMVMLVESTGWRFAMTLPGIVALAALAVIVCLMKGTIKPVTPGQTFAPLLVMLKNKNMWFLTLSCASVYGAYYAVVGQTGQKTLQDLYSLPAGKAAFIIMILTLIVAANNMLGNYLLKFLGGRRKAALMFGVTCSLLGPLAAKIGFLAGDWGFVLFLLSSVLLAIPAGFFPLFGLAAKELNAPEYMGMSVAYLNFIAFVFISLYQNVCGMILKRYPCAEGSLAFPVEAYSAVYLFFLIGAVISFAAVCFVPETLPKGEK